MINSEKIKNILVFRNDRFGEFILNIPALRALKDTFTYANIVAVVNPDVREVAEDVPFIDEIIEWDSEKHTFTEQIQMVKLLRKKNFDIAIMMNPSQELNCLTFFSGIPIRAGYDKKWGFLLTHKIKDLKYLGQKHEVEYNLQLVDLVGAYTEDMSLYLTVDEQRINNLWGELGLAKFKTIIAVHPWTSDSVKQWPLENFQDLMKRLTALYPEFCLAIIGGIENLMKSKKLFSRMGEHLIDLTGRTSLKQLAAFLKKCKLLISCDSGPVHLSCAVGTPVVVLFRNDLMGKTPARWGPWGQGHSVIEKESILDITVDGVIDRLKEILQR